MWRTRPGKRQVRSGLRLEHLARHQQAEKLCGFAMLDHLCHHFASVDFILTLNERSVNSSFDLLSDIGGLSGILYSFFSLFVNAWNFNLAGNFVIKQLFKWRPPKLDGAKQAEEVEFKVSSLTNFKVWLLGWLPRKGHCFNRRSDSRDLEMLNHARQILEQEACLVSVIQAQRFFDETIKTILTPNEYAEIKERSKYHIVQAEAQENQVI